LSAVSELATSSRIVYGIGTVKETGDGMCKRYGGVDKLN
jgi:hypothetical protein